MRFWVFLFLLFVGCNMAEPKLERGSDIPTEGFGGGPVNRHVRDVDGNLVSSVSEGYGFRILWKSQQNPDGAEVVDVLDAVRSHLRSLQKTNSGSNDAAKVLWEVEKSISAIVDSGMSKDLSKGTGPGFVVPSNEDLGNVE